MRWFKWVAPVLLAMSGNGWCAQSQNRALPLDPIVFSSGLPKDDKPLPWQGVTKKEPLKTRYFLPTGFIFPARLENAVYSYNVETPAIAVVERNVEYLKKVVIPAGSRVIGTVSVHQEHDRILITFHALVFPEGDEIKFSGIALMLDGSAGIKGKVETHKDSAVASTVLQSVISGTQELLAVSGVSPVAAQAAQGASSEMTNELGNQRQQVTTSISVDADTGLRIFVPQRIEY